MMSVKFLETIKIEKRHPKNIIYHNQRLNRTRRDFFGLKDEIDILDFIPQVSDEKLYRLRLIYSKDVEKVELIPYKKRIPKSFRLINFEENYSYKFLDRTPLESLKRESIDVDEIILLKDGMLGDTTIANIALLIDGEWFTPACPILKGTTRARFLKEGLIKAKNLYPEDLKRAKKLALLNAMVEFLVLENFKIKE
jgi:4-amino-4-deoxychorismate lyase